MDLKNTINGTAKLNCMKSDGIAVYDLIDNDGTIYTVEIDLSDKDDVNKIIMFQDENISMKWLKCKLVNKCLHS